LPAHWLLLFKARAKRTPSLALSSVQSLTNNLSAEASGKNNAAIRRAAILNLCFRLGRFSDTLAPSPQAFISKME